MLWTLLLACHSESDTRPRYDDSPPVVDTDPDGDDTGGSGDCGDCPCDMKPVGDPVAFCVDAYEGDVDGDGGLGNPDQGAGWPDGSTTAVPLSVAGVEPQVNITWYQAYALCANAGKHLCTWDEWRDACDSVPGEGGATYPWGEYPQADDLCAASHADGTSEYDALQLTGAFERCRTESGVYDQLGNAWEWVDLGEVDGAGKPVPGKVGGAFYAGHASASCAAEPSREHPPEFEGTITLRCCAPPG